ncbi:PHP domain-containing protein [Natrononativus amylolyticus]|uniref:PHP domain-containing protein n=1 Tax=Natrononativus amylolyticus TaxID=2963434 RepID=UPI0020CF36ED|nr:PHP domain-containing protein [Natrononativus amylolyticus]
MSLTADYHVHTNYSDGRPLPEMLSAAADAGLEAVGFADHCNVSERSPLAATKRELGFNLDLTYERRRAALEALAAETGLRLYDAVELDYDPRDEAAIEAFLEEAGFEYAIGSVHEMDGTVIFDQDHFAAKSESAIVDLIDDYYARLCALIESELFDVVAHLDAIERTPALRGYTTANHWQAVADALAASSTLPEINAGAIDGYGEYHPEPAFLEALRAADVSFVPGTDSHRGPELEARTAALATRFGELGLEPAAPPSL